MTLDASLLSWVLVGGALGSVAFGAAAIWMSTEDKRNIRKLARLAGGRFDTEETSSMSAESKYAATFTVEYWHDHLSVEPLVNLLNENGFKVSEMVHGSCKTASSYPIVVCTVSSDMLVSETNRMVALLKSQGIDCFSVEGCHIPDQLTEIMLLGRVTAFAKPGEREAAEAEALRESAVIEG
jgi:hypothetical protein